MKLLLFVTLFLVVENCFVLSLEHQHQLDPRKILPDGNLSFVDWQVGNSYFYEFSSKAAHISTPLPNPQKVNPQAALEDLGLFPFASMYGSVTLDCLCRPTHDTTLFKVSVKANRKNCVEDSIKVKNNCQQMTDLADTIADNDFWLTIDAFGAITGILFADTDPTIIAVKKNLVGELSLTIPGPNDDPVMFERLRSIGAAKYATRYRVHQFARHLEQQSDLQRVEGLVIHKEKLAVRPPTGKETIASRRESWVYMIVGGDINPNSVPASVPTRVVSLEEVQVDPSLMVKNPTDKLYVLSRLTLDLLTINPITRAPPVGCKAPLNTPSVRFADLS